MDCQQKVVQALLLNTAFYFRVCCTVYNVKQLLFNRKVKNCSFLFCWEAVTRLSRKPHKSPSEWNSLLKVDKILTSLQLEIKLWMLGWFHYHCILCVFLLTLVRTWGGHWNSNGPGWHLLLVGSPCVSSFLGTPRRSASGLCWRFHAKRQFH